ncbi:DUF397 domain-containing protein [Streptomyces sp. NPDC048330]|uniref:DUF397 domain-containing protein n=1 Tax=Streptomyces sp. NPDC048330 TaxID=3365533 RepID=UPI00371C937E
MIRKATIGDADEMVWFKSSYSDGNEGDSCVEVAASSLAVHVRDSKDVGGPQLSVSARSWAGFVAYATGG